MADKRIQTPNEGFQMIGDGTRWTDMTRTVAVPGLQPPNGGNQELEPADFNTMLSILDEEITDLEALELAFFGAQGALLGILKSAATFAILGTSTITNTGASTVYGDIGLQPPGVSITGFQPPSGGVVNGPTSTGLVAGPGVDTGTIHIADGVATQAQADALAAFLALKALPAGTDISGQNLGGKVLTPGQWDFTAAAALNSTPLTIDFQNTPNARVVIRVGTDLTVAPAAVVNVINGDSTNGLYWVIGTTVTTGVGSATFGTTSQLAGNFLAYTSITFNTGATLVAGRAFALGAAVTLDTNKISRDASAQAFGTGRGDFASFGFSGGGTAASIGAIPAAPASSIPTGLTPAGTIVATGTTAANSTPVAHQIEVVTGADGTKGVTLPTATPGSLVYLYNKAGALLKVWPKGAGEIINSLAPGTNISQSANTSAVYAVGVTGSWFTIPLVPS